MNLYYSDFKEQLETLEEKRIRYIKEQNVEISKITSDIAVISKIQFYSEISKDIF